MINPRRDPKRFDVIKLAGVTSPGRMRFPSGPPARPKGWEKQAGKGTSGARLVHSQEPPIEFSVEILCVNDEQYAAWDEFQRVLDTPTDVVVTTSPPLPDGYIAAVTIHHYRASRLPPAERKARIAELDKQVQAKEASLATSAHETRALAIEHPNLAQIGCTSVVIASWSPPSRDLGKDIPAKIAFIESKPLTAAGSGTVNGSILGGGNPRNGLGGGADPNQDLKDRIAAKTREYGEV
jgi:hypothetical protein